MAQAVVDEADVRTPALVASDGGGFIPPRFSIPEFLEIAVKIAKAAEPAAELAGSHVAVVIDHDGGFASRAGHRPGVRGLHVFKLHLVVEGECALVVCPPQAVDQAAVVPGGNARIVSVYLSNFSIEGGKAFRGNSLERRVFGAAPDDVEVVAIHAAVLPNEAADFQHAIKILRADYRIDVDPQVGEFIPAGLEGLQRFQSFFKIARDGAYGILHSVKAVHGHIKVE